MERREWEILINRPTPSLNQFSYEVGPWKQRKEKRLWWILIRSSPGFVKIPKAKVKRHLIVERYGIKKLDPDNLVGGLKMAVVDNLIKHGLLVDDTDEWLSLEAKNCKLQSGVKPFTRLILVDIEPA